MSLKFRNQSPYAWQNIPCADGAAQAVLFVSGSQEPEEETLRVCMSWLRNSVHLSSLHSLWLWKLWKLQDFNIYLDRLVVGSIMCLLQYASESLLPKIAMLGASHIASYPEFHSISRTLVWTPNSPLKKLRIMSGTMWLMKNVSSNPNIDFFLRTCFSKQTHCNFLSILPRDRNPTHL